MAENPKAICSTVDDSETIPLMAEGSDEVSEHFNMKPRGSSITQSDEGCARADVVPAVKGDADIEKVEAAAVGDDRKEIGEVEVEREASQILQPSPSDLALAAACKCTTAAESSVKWIRATLEAIDVGRKRKAKALREADAVASNNEAEHYRDLARRYDTAITLATKRVREMEAASKSAESAAKEAEDAVRKMEEVFSEASNENEQIMEDLRSATLAANAAAIMAYKLEYCAVKAMKQCCEELEPFNAVTEETQCMERENRKVLEYIVSAITFIFGCLVLAAGLSYLNKSGREDNFASLLTIGTILVTLPALYLLFRSIMWCKNKVIEAKRKRNAIKMEKIDERLEELQQYFANNGIDHDNLGLDGEE